MKDETFLWQDIFAAERICPIEIAHYISSAPDGMNQYTPKQKTHAVIIKDQRQKNKAEQQRKMTFLLPGDLKLAPGDLITAAEGVFEIAVCEACCNLENRVIAWKCQII